MGCVLPFCRSHEVPRRGPGPFLATGCVSSPHLEPECSGLERGESLWFTGRGSESRPGGRMAARLPSGGRPDGPQKGGGLAERNCGEPAQAEAPAPGADGRWGAGLSAAAAVARGALDGGGRGGVADVISPPPENALLRAETWRGPCGQTSLSSRKASHEPPRTDLQPRGHGQMASSGPTLGPGRSRAEGEGQTPLLPLHEFTTCRAVVPKSNRAWKRVSCKGSMGRPKRPRLTARGGDAEGGNHQLARAVSSWI